MSKTRERIALDVASTFLGNLTVDLWASEVEAGFRACNKWDRIVADLKFTREVLDAVGRGKTPGEAYLDEREAAQRCGPRHCPPKED